MDGLCKSTITTTAWKQKRKSCPPADTFAWQASCTSPRARLMSPSSSSANAKPMTLDSPAGRPLAGARYPGDLTAEAGNSLPETRTRVVATKQRWGPPQPTTEAGDDDKKGNIDAKGGQDMRHLEAVAFLRPAMSTPPPAASWRNPRHGRS